MRNYQPRRGAGIVTGWTTVRALIRSHNEGCFSSPSLGTDAQKLAAYDSLVANSGRYSVDGDELTLEAYMARHPNYMADREESTQTLTFKIDDGILSLVWPDTERPFANLRATLRRPGGG